MGRKLQYIIIGAYVENGYVLIKNQAVLTYLVSDCPAKCAV